MRSHSRKTAWFLIVFAVLFMLAAAFFPALACHHDCSGDDCPVCLQMHVWTGVLRLFGAVALCALLYLHAHLSVQRCLHRLSDAFVRITPVLLKTKLLN